MKTYLFTHTDFDGVGCAVLATIAYGYQPEDLEITYVDYRNINDAIMRFIADRAGDQKEFRLIITDVAPEGDNREKVAEAINVLYEAKRAKVFLCDHHDTSSWIEKYSWARHDVSKNMCGTKLFYDFLRHGGHAFAPQVTEFAECACAYDNWLLDHPLRSRSESINRYLYFIRFDNFVWEFSQNPAADQELAFVHIVDQLKRNEESYINNIIERQCQGDFVLEDREGNRYCILVCERNISQVCHRALHLQGPPSAIYAYLRMLPILLL